MLGTQERTQEHAVVVRSLTFAEIHGGLVTSSARQVCKGKCKESRAAVYSSSSSSLSSCCARRKSTRGLALAWKWARPWGLLPLACQKMTAASETASTA